MEQVWDIRVWINSKEKANKYFLNIDSHYFIHITTTPKKKWVTSIYLMLTDSILFCGAKAHLCYAVRSELWDRPVAKTKIWFWHKDCTSLTREDQTPFNKFLQSKAIVPLLEIFPYASHTGFFIVLIHVNQTSNNCSLLHWWPAYSVRHSTSLCCQISNRVGTKGGSEDRTAHSHKPEHLFQ